MGTAEERLSAAWALGQTGRTDALPELMRSATDDPSAIPTLASMLDDERWEVRANAVQGLGMIGDPSARLSVEPLTDDPNSMVRQAADSALAKLR